MPFYLPQRLSPLSTPSTRGFPRTPFPKDDGGGFEFQSLVLISVRDRTNKRTAARSNGVLGASEGGPMIATDKGGYALRERGSRSPLARKCLTVRRPPPRVSASHR